MTGPAKSKYQGIPWQPTVDSSNGDEKKAAADYTAVYGGTPVYGKSSDDVPPPVAAGSIPALAAAYTSAPDLVPVAPTGSSSGDAALDTRTGAFSIDLGALLAAEQTCLTATTESVAAYEDIRRVVTAAIASPSLFGQNVGATGTNINAGGKLGDETGRNASPETNWDDLDKNSVKFAASMNPQLHNLVVSAGNAIELMGHFAAMLNNAGQMYTSTDANSAFTAPGGTHS